MTRLRIDLVSRVSGLSVPEGALTYAKNRVSIIPLASGASKRALVGWKPYQRQVANVHFPTASIGLITERLNGTLAVERRLLFLWQSAGTFAANARRARGQFTVQSWSAISMKGKQVSRSNTKEAKKPKLKLVTTNPAVRLGGALPGMDMAPGKYLALCENAWLERIGKKYRAVLQFRIVDGKYDGVAVRMWIDGAADTGGFVSPVGKFARTCAIALGRPVEEDDPLDEPGEFFSGRCFIVFVGYRKSEHPGGGGQSSEERAMVKKDDRDYLRVHEIISREDLL